MQKHLSQIINNRLYELFLLLKLNNKCKTYTFNFTIY